MTDALSAIEVDRFLPYPPATVWRAVTDPDLLARWLMPNDFEPVVGHRFRMQGIPVPAVGFSGKVTSQVLELEPEHLLRISWSDAEQGNALVSTVTFTLVPEGTGTRFLIRHDGFDPADPAQVAAHQIMSGGWANRIAPALEELLESVA